MSSVERPPATAVAARARAEAGDLVDAAWRSAREDVLEELRAAMRSTIRRAVDDRLSAVANDGGTGPLPARSSARSPAEPAARPDGDRESAGGSGTGWYVFGVTDAEPDAVAGWPGMDADGPTIGVGPSGLVAVVCRVALEQFEEEQFRAHVDDVEWLEAKVRAHEVVLERLLEAGSVLPMRFGSIYRSTDDVVAMLDRHRAALTAGLARVRGRVEWSVRGRVDGPALQRWVRDRLPEPRGDAEPGERGEGASYLAERARDRAVADGMDAEVGAALGRLEAAVGAVAAEWARGDPPAARDPEVVFQAAFLVDRDRAWEFLDGVAATRAELEPRGIGLEVTGPWPPSTFTSMDLTVEAGS